MVGEVRLLLRSVALTASSRYWTRPTQIVQSMTVSAAESRERTCRDSCKSISEPSRFGTTQRHGLLLAADEALLLFLYTPELNQPQKRLSSGS
jgi:hypothetical protein